MKKLQELLKQSVEEHRQLHSCLRDIEKRLPLLDLDSTVQAAVELDKRFTRIQNTDQEILTNLRPMETEIHRQLIEERLELGRTLVALYKTLTPRLQTRLAGYRAELIRIRQGLTTMGGYADSTGKTGSLINTSN